MANPIALSALSLTQRQPYVRPRVKNDRPAYGVVGQGFFDDKDKKWEPGTALYFDGEPNADLYPLNKLAYDRMQLFLDKLDTFGEEKAKRDKKAYIRQPRKEWIEEDIEDELPQPQYVMGSRKEGSNEAIR